MPLPAEIKSVLESIASGEELAAALSKAVLGGIRYLEKPRTDDERRALLSNLGKIYGPFRAGLPTVLQLIQEEFNRMFASNSLILINKIISSGEEIVSRLRTPRVADINMLKLHFDDCEKLKSVFRVLREEFNKLISTPPTV